MGAMDLHMSVDFEEYVRSIMLTGQIFWYDCLCNVFSFKQAALQMFLAIVMKACPSVANVHSPSINPGNTQRPSHRTFLPHLLAKPS
jgi:hypothetical protein